MKSSVRVILLVSVSFAAAAGRSQAVQTQTPSAGGQVISAGQIAEMQAKLADWPQLEHYRAVNAALAPAARGEDRVVFYGASMTEGWGRNGSTFFPGKPYVNRGIGGQTTPQMLVRFRQDVIDLHPKAVLILAGTNDIAGNTGPMRLEDIEADYASLAELARAHDIKVIYASVLPVYNYTEKSKDFFAQRPPEKILELNRWLQNYCAPSSSGETRNCVYLDYFSALVDDKGLMKKDLADDGLHPNAAGFKIMAPLAEAAIEQALK